MLQNPLAKFNITIKELRENASFTATMNVNAFVEAVKRHVSYAHHADAQNDSGAEELLTIVEETGLDPGSPRKAATAPSESQALVALVRSGGETPQTQVRRPLSSCLDISHCLLVGDAAACPPPR